MAIEIAVGVVGAAFKAAAPRLGRHVSRRFREYLNNVHALGLLQVPVFVLTLLQLLTIALPDALEAAMLRDELPTRAILVFNNIADCADAALLALHKWLIGDKTAAVVEASEALRGQLDSFAHLREQGLVTIGHELDAAIRDIDRVLAGVEYVVDRLAEGGKVGKEEMKAIAKAAVTRVSSGGQKLEEKGACEVAAMAWSPDGRILAVAFHEGPPKLYDAATGELRFVLGGYKAKTSVKAIAWEPQTQEGAPRPVLAVGSSDRSVIFFHGETGLRLQVLEMPAPVTRLEWSPEWGRLAVGLDNRTVSLWTEGWQQPYRLPGEMCLVGGVAWNRAGDALATVTRNKVQVWKLRASGARELSQTLEGLGDSPIRRVSWNPDGVLLAAVAGDRTAVWDTETGDRLHLVKHKDAIWDMEWSPDGRTLATAAGAKDDKHAVLWNAGREAPATERAQLRHEGWLRSVSWSLHGDMVASASENGKVEVWLANGRSHRTLTCASSSKATLVSWSPDGRTLAAAAGKTLLRGGRVMLWTVRVGLGAIQSIRN